MVVTASMNMILSCSLKGFVTASMQMIFNGFGYLCVVFMVFTLLI